MEAVLDELTKNAGFLTPLCSGRRNKKPGEDRALPGSQIIGDALPGFAEVSKEAN